MVFFEGLMAFFEGLWTGSEGWLRAGSGHAGRPCGVFGGLLEWPRVGRRAVDSLGAGVSSDGAIRRPQAAGVALLHDLK
jgi:hypothetical protein